MPLNSVSYHTSTIYWHNVNFVIKVDELVLRVNSSRCEMTLLEHTEQEAAVTTGMIQAILPGLLKVLKEDCCLSVVPHSVKGIPAAFRKKAENLDK